MNIGVCTVQIPFIRGGAESMAENLILALREHGHRVENINLPFKWYPKEQILRDSLTWRLIDITESYFKKIDVVIPIKYPAYLVRHPCKVVWLAHQFREVYDCFGTNLSGLTTSDEDMTLRRTIVRWDTEAFLESRHVFTISQNVSRRLLHYNGIESRHIYVPPKLIGHYLPPRDGSYIFCPGRLELSKRLDIIINALPLLPRSMSLVIAGSGPREGNLRELVDSLDCSDRVNFTGYLSDDQLLRMYSEAAAVFFAPHDEDLGLITLEAFHAKKPVVTCHDAGAVLEFVEDSVTGRVSEASPAAVAETVIDLLANKKRCREMGEEGFRRIAHITWNNVIDTLLDDVG